MRFSNYLLQCSSGLYFFRLKVPDALQLTIGKTEIKKSLKTYDTLTAQARAIRLMAVCKRLFNQLRKKEGRFMTPNEMNKILDIWTQKILDDDEKDRVARDRITDEDDISLELDLYGSFRSEAREQLGKSDYRKVTSIADELIAEHNLKLSPLEYKTVCREILKRSVRIFEIQERRTVGDYVQCHPSGSIGLTVAATLTDQGRLLSEVIDHYLNEKKESVNEKTLNEYRGNFGILVKAIGDVPIKTVDRETMSQYKGILTQLPKNMNQRKAYRDKTPKELLNMEIPDKDRMAKENVNKLLRRSAELFNHAKKNGFYTDENPATGIQLPKSRREGEFREAYTEDELATIFCSPMYLKAEFQHPYQYWLPLLGLFTAARLNELASLYLSDIRHEDGLWIIDINMNAPDKSTKTESSERKIPIHPTLVDLGLIDYRNRLESRGGERLFPELPHSKFDGYGRKAGRWINTVYLAGLGLKDKDKQKDFHSLRKTLTTHLERQGAEFFAIKQLDGHSVGDDITMKYYTQKYSPKEMMDRVLSKINYPLDFGKFKRIEWGRVK